jgi:peptide/nickel transport system substrate-binding protein
MYKSTKPIWLILVLIAGVLLAACAGQTPAEEDTGAEPEEPTTAEDEEPAAPSEDAEAAVSEGFHLDPANIDSDNEDAVAINSLVYDQLVIEEDGLTVLPGLASSWIVSDDGLDYKFFLRRNAEFHDGSTVDADAVIANFNRWFDPEDSLHGSAPYSEWEAAFLGFRGETNADGTAKSTVDAIEKEDNFTVLVHLSRQDPLMLVNLAQPAFSIVSKEVLEQAGGDNYGSSADSVSGSGPYMVDSWTDESLVLVPNPDYWGEVPEGELEFSLE